MINYHHEAARILSSHYGMRSDALILNVLMARAFVERSMGAMVSRNGNETTVGDMTACGPELGILAVYIVTRYPKVGELARRPG